MENERKALTRPVLLLALLGLVAIGAGFGLLYQHQQDQARAAAAEQARSLAGTLAGELGQRVNRHRAQLEQLAGRPDSRQTPASEDLIPTPWVDHTRALRVPDGHPGEQRLSFTLRELLYNLRERGEVVVSSRGGEQPALLIARTVPGGALILEHDLTPWLNTLDQRLPNRSAFTLSQGDLTLVRRGQTGAEAATADARGGPFTLTLSVTPTPLTWKSLLLPAGLSAAALLLVIYAVFTRPARRRSATASAAQSPSDTEIAPEQPEPSPPTRLPPAPAPEPEPEPGAAPAEALFGPHGIRATRNAPLDDTALEQLGRAIGSEAGAVGQHTLFLATAGEASGDSRRALTEGLLASGRQVVDLGLAPAAVLYYATEVLESRSGVCLIGSGGDLGLEIVIDGEPLHGDRLIALRQRLLTHDLHQGDGQLEQRDINDRYLTTVADDIILARPMSVAVQGQSAAAGLAPRLFEELGCKVVAVESTDPDALGRTVTGESLNLGFAFPAHGGLSLVTASGERVAADRLLMLLARDLLERNPGADVLFDVQCSRALASVIRKQGGRPVMDRSGPARLRARMKELAVPLAGEASGHILFADRWYGFSDALYAAARLLEILSLQEGDSSEVFATLTTGAVSPEFALDVGEQHRSHLLAGLTERAERFPGGRANTVDGVRVDFPDGWGLVIGDARDSGVLLARFEGRDTQALERVQALFREQFQAVDDGLSLPF